MRFINKTTVSAVLVLLLSISCQPASEEMAQYTAQPGKLVVLIRNIPTVYFVGPEFELGFEYELVRAFAEHEKLELDLRVFPDLKKMRQAVQKKDWDIAAGGFTRTPKREKVYNFGPDYFLVQQEVVCHREISPPKRLEDLLKVKLMVRSRTSYEERLEEIKEALPELTWQSVEFLPTEQILEKVWKKEVDCTIADSNVVAVNRRYFPELKVASAITEWQPLAWGVRKGAPVLTQALTEWFKEFGQTRDYTALRERYYSPIEIFDFVDIRALHRKIDQELPKYRKRFEEAGKKYSLPWTWLAAKAYQESHWNPNAKSPTGVRGMMMLTQRTAGAMGVKNRMDAYESIMGGARYMRQVMNGLPVEINGVDRIIFCMAAYNIGMGHLNDARQLAKSLGRDPNLWRDMKEVLPLLAQPKYYKTLKYGYARGTEPVRYVHRIQNYRDIIERQLGVRR